MCHQAGIIVGGEQKSWGVRGDAAMTHELLHGRPARISTRSTNHTDVSDVARYPGTEPNRHA